MGVKQLPKNWLIHSVEYFELTGKDSNYNTPIYDGSVMINNVRVDVDKVTVVSGSEYSKQDLLVVFVDYENSSFVTDFKVKSKIKFRGNEYIVEKVIPCYHPFIERIHHYELEMR